MESEGQVPCYSVLTKEQIRAKIDEVIGKISEIFPVSESDATVMLLSQRWDASRVLDRLGDDDEGKFLEESGLKPDGSRRDHESRGSGSCGICSESSTTGVVLISTPMCSHSFCTTCWEKCLGDRMKHNPSHDNISCPDPGCTAAVGPDTVRALPETVKEMYERHVLRSYIKRNNETLKPCPAPDCEYVIQMKDEDDDDHDDDDECLSRVVCACAHTFCWKCERESHRPVTCNNVSDWYRVFDVADESLSDSWIAENTKPCPRCFRPIDFHVEGGYRFLICPFPCRFRFCWKCLRSEEEHEDLCSEALVPVGAPLEVRERWWGLTDFSHEHRELCKDRFFGSHELMQQAISELHDMDKTKVPELCEKFSAREEDLWFVREAWILMIQSRQILKWSYVYDYFLSEYESAKKQYLQHLQDKAIDTLYNYSEALKAETEEALMSDGGDGDGEGTRSRDLGALKRKLSNMTRRTGNYFHRFVKTLREGMPEVKVTSYYDDVAGDHWFCDRCTYQNRWSDKGCQKCFDPLASPSSSH